MLALPHVDPVDAFWLLRTWRRRRALFATIDARTARATYPTRPEGASVDGLDPLRIRVMGSGLAAGSGVRSRREAIDGFLARRLAAATGRGVRVFNAAQPDAYLADQIDAASISQTLSFDDVLIWSPGPLEMCDRLWPRSWTSRLSSLLREVSEVEVVAVLAMPVPQHAKQTSALGPEIAARLNAALERAVRRFPRVLLVQPPPLLIDEQGIPAIDADYYAVCADRIAAVVLPRVLSVPKRWT